MARSRKAKDDHKPVLVEKVACDWLTLTTYDQDVYNDWFALVERMKVSVPTRAAFSQYSGISWQDGVTIVEGVQGKGVHHIMTVSGAIAQEALQYFREWKPERIAPMKCKRFDVQITLFPQPGRPDLVELTRQAKGGLLGEFKGRGRSKMEAYLGDEADTMYIGARVSETFARVYDKIIKGLNGLTEKWERYEVEYKESRSIALFNRLMAGSEKGWEEPMREAIKGHVDKCPDGLIAWLSVGHTDLLGGVGLEPKHTPRGKSKRGLWVEQIGDALALAAQMPGKEGEDVRQTLLFAYLRGVLGDNAVGLGGAKVVLENGHIYNPQGVLYTNNHQSGGVTVSEIHNSTVTIDGDLVGRDKETAQPHTRKQERGNEEQSNGTS